MSISLNSDVVYKSLKKGEVLFRKNQIARELFIQKKGCICIFDIKKSRVIPYRVVGENELVASNLASSDRKEYTYYAVALEDSELISISKSDIDSFLGESSVWLTKVLKQISEKVDQTQKTVYEHGIVADELFNPSFSLEVESLLMSNL